MEGITAMSWWRFRTTGRESEGDFGQDLRPFLHYQERSGRNRAGLSISYSIIEKLGGKITVSSEEGKGTTFTIYVPARGFAT